MADSIVFQNLDDRRADLERHRENAARAAEATGRFRSVGQGSLEFPTRVAFGITFMTRPGVTYGSEIDLDALDEQLGGDPHDNITPAMPLVVGYVTDWDTDSRGYYTGAWCGARVYYPPEDGVPITTRVEIIHHFRFSAIGIKDIPVDLTN